MVERYLSINMYSRCLVFLFLLMSGCLYHDTHDIEDAIYVCDPATISWQTDILPIMDQYCATSGCHDGITRLDWTDYEKVKEYATSIRAKTQDRSMPFDGPLPQIEIDKIACWVDAGTLNN